MPEMKHVTVTMPPKKGALDKEKDEKKKKPSIPDAKETGKTKEC
jgi:hypothetical protein